MKEFDVEIHMYQYFKGSIFQDHSDSMRRCFLKHIGTESYS